jgi:penicillin-insensitive murein endopeptidase
VRTICLIGLTFALCGFATPSADEGAPAPAQTVRAVQWRHSHAVGTPAAGRLVRGVQLPAAGARFFTWDPLLHRRPDRPGRRWGTDFLVRKVIGVVAGYAEAHPSAPRLGVGDLSRRRGGPFGPRHASHQNGLDVDVYYPRRDRRERPPLVASQVEHRLAQDLVDRFVAAGAIKVYVGPDVGLHGRRGIVTPLIYHDDHLHVRFSPRRVNDPVAG